MTDDPWKKTDPIQPPPAYGPPPGYGPQPGFNAYGAPLPKSRGYKRLFLWLGLLSLLVLAGCGTGIYLLVNSLTKNADAANAFLRDVRDQRFDAAFDRICPIQQSQRGREPFVAGLEEADSSGHGVTKYDITSSETSSSNGDTTRTASGTVTFADGQTRDVSFDLGKYGSRLCISGGYRQLN